MCCQHVLESVSPPLEPGPDAVTAHLDIDPVPASVGLARSFLREILADVDSDDRDTALLLTSELVTNAILHARTPVQIGVVLDRGSLLVCVADRLPSGQVTSQGHSPNRPSGRGLALVSDLSRDWGTTSYAGGKTVWFVMPAHVRSMSVR